MSEAGSLSEMLGEKLPIGALAADGVDWLMTHFGGLFDGFADGAETLIGWILTGFQTPPEWAVIALFALITAALQRRVVPVLIVVGALLFVLNQGYWEETTETLTLVITATLICMVIGVPVGILAAHHPRFHGMLRPVLDLMQTLPTFVYLIPAIVFFGIGMVPGLIATAIFVLPAPIRLTALGVASTPATLIEAGRAFGATPWQLLVKVELPHALPQIMAGLTQAIMLSLSMVVIAALVGADGLGVPVVRALNTVNTALGFEAGMVIVVVAIMLDRMVRKER